VFDPVEIEEFREGWWGLGELGERGCAWGRDYTNDERYCCSAGLCEEVCYEKRVGEEGWGNVRVGGEVMIRGGVVRMRCRAR
jgi:hypothetical protein